MENTDNGHQENNVDSYLDDKGVNVLRRYDASVRMENRQYNSVLQQSLHSHIPKSLYHELLTANWASEDDCRDWLNAYAECRRYGAETEWLERWLVAHKAGLNSGRFTLVLETISHSTFTMNNQMNQKRGVFDFIRNRNKGEVQSKNPLS